MHIRILGSAAGGGFPQWNCNCRNCRGLREGTLRAKARTQSSIALSDDGVNWIVCNASPDIRAQIESFPALQPARALRDTAIRALILLDSQIDHTTGLLTLREGCPHEVWCSEMVHQDLTTGFPLFNMLSHWHGGLRWNPIALEQSFTVAACPALRFTPIPLRSAAPPYSPHRNDPHPGDNLGLLVEDVRTGGKLFYAPGLGHKLGSAMGHLPQSGTGGMLEVLERLPKPRKVLIHINNTNPILDEDSAERAELDARGIEVSWDGMQIEL